MKSSESAIQFSIVLAVYNNETYAQDLYRSLDSQTIAPEKLEIIIVDDGSTDESFKIAREWKADTRFTVKLLSQENAGVSAARNTGISAASGRWIAFVDSDDVLHPDYFNALSEFDIRDSYGSASMLSSRSVIFLEDKGLTIDNHPLGWKYKRGDRLVSLIDEPHVVHLGGHSTIVRRDIVDDNGLRFNGEVRPGFEDADFNGRYLSHFSEPVLGLVASARYYYRKRSDGTSLIDTAWTKTEKFTHEPKYGHLGMLRYVTDQLGYTPVWAQNMVLYGLYWYFTADRSWKNPFASLDEKVLDDFWETLDEIFKLIEASTLRNFPIRNFGWYLSEGLLRYFKDEAWVESNKSVVYQWGGVEKKLSAQKYVYSYKGKMPREKFYSNGRRVKAIYSKSIRHDLFGRHLMNERILALPANTNIEIRLGGKRSIITKVPAFNRIPSFKSNVPKRLVLLPGTAVVSPHEEVAEFRQSLNRMSTISFSPRLVTGRVRAATAILQTKAVEEAWVSGTTVRDAKIRILKRSAKRVGGSLRSSFDRKRNRRFVKSTLAAKDNRAYQGAWIFMDRPDRADDNAEHLYRYARVNHPEINSWFMLSRSSKDWKRLTDEGFRLIPYGEPTAIPAVLKAAFILSSHMDTDVYEPIDRKKYGGIGARRIFLQHGITMNDISRWINTKNLALVAACSPGEVESIVADETHYRLMRRQISMTGFPRHDRLSMLAQASPMSERDRLMIVPTWRKDLADQLRDSETETARIDILHRSEFYRAWADLLTNSDFIMWINTQGLKPMFALHDHLSPYAEVFNFGNTVEVVPFSEISIQETLADSKIVITDYSSLGIEAAVAGAAVVYYQFDAGSIYEGGHTFKKSWFSYSDHGAGPVAATVDEIMSGLNDLADSGWKIPLVYQDRLKTLLPNLDGSASARVIEAVKQL
ncbi:glycosyltransferase involved in cell wall biosynthesis [Arthrobacter stackebrandtii]|uniref:Glycosyltransferase involved in cell wall biosynthesis n=1 Tax=Arthrobacter stackebrandtii TaxID=272161 RepID=A0ABS4YZ21_9MICC|nr:glycosyltransferase [Arthrobacter stackebrandtii]MBP2414046.1 glycosyltransferase involved in cell wall biosynthesis [Arthrobacter stackebrandtii]